MAPAGDRAKSLRNTVQAHRLWKDREAPGWVPPAASFQERGNQADFLERKGQLKPEQLGKREYIHMCTECVRAKLLQSRPILCDPVDCSPPGSSVHGVLQARVLEGAAMPSSRGSSRPRD